MIPDDGLRVSLHMKRGARYCLAFRSTAAKRVRGAATGFGHDVASLAEAVAAEVTGIVDEGDPYRCLGCPNGEAFIAGALAGRGGRA